MASSSKWVEKQEGYFVGECESSMDVARDCAEMGVSTGFWVQARTQTQGRGRAGHDWVSQDGNMHVSIVVRPKDLDPDPVRLMTWIPLAAAVGVGTALESFGKTLDIFYKWPNDLYLLVPAGWAKVGGLLCEGSTDLIIIGIGVNLVKAPKVKGRLTTHLKGGEVEYYCRPVVDSVMLALERLYRDGPSEFETAFRERGVLTPDQPIAWGEDCRGLVVGLGPAGELRVRDEQGQVRALYAEDVTLAKESR